MCLSVGPFILLLCLGFLCSPNLVLGLPVPVPNAGNQYDLIAFRNQLQPGAPAEPPVPGGLAAFTPPGQPFEYTRDANGRVRSVVGFISPVASAPAFGPINAASNTYCNGLVNPSGVPVLVMRPPGDMKKCGLNSVLGAVAPLPVQRTNSAGVQVDATVDRGHIVAQSLGGSNRELINLMPQWDMSNRLNGRWNKFERALREIIKYPGCQILADRPYIEIILRYDDGPLLPVPRTAGTTFIGGVPAGIPAGIPFSSSPSMAAAVGAIPDTRIVPTGGYYSAFLTANCQAAIVAPTSIVQEFLQSQRVVPAVVPIPPLVAAYPNQYGTEWSNGPVDQSPSQTQISQMNNAVAAAAPAVPIIPAPVPGGPRLGQLFTPFRKQSHFHTMVDIPITFQFRILLDADQPTFYRQSLVDLQQDPHWGGIYQIYAEAPIVTNEIIQLQLDNANTPIPVVATVAQFRQTLPPGLGNALLVDEEFYEYSNDVDIPFSEQQPNGYTVTEVNVFYSLKWVVDLYIDEQPYSTCNVTPPPGERIIDLRSELAHAGCRVPDDDRLWSFKANVNSGGYFLRNFNPYLIPDVIHFDRTLAWQHLGATGALPVTEQTLQVIISAVPRPKKIIEGRVVPGKRKFERDDDDPSDDNLPPIVKRAKLSVTDPNGNLLSQDMITDSSGSTDIMSDIMFSPDILIVDLVNLVHYILAPTIKSDTPIYLQVHDQWLNLPSDTLEKVMFSSFGFESYSDILIVYSTTLPNRNQSIDYQSMVCKRTRQLQRNTGCQAT